MSRYLDMFTFVKPPVTNGSSLGTKTPEGARAATTHSAAASEIVLKGDIFLQPPDLGGNQAGADYKGDVLVEFHADGDAMDVIFGASGAALTPDSAATGTSGNVSDFIANGERVRWMLAAGSGRHDSIYVKNRAQANATLRYRVISTLPGTR